MKRVLLILFGLLVINIPVFAQFGAFSQRGRATQEMNVIGFFAAHNNIPLGSTVVIKNTITGNEIEVIISGRIPVSPDRIADLSLYAWEALEMNADTVILLSFTPQRQIDFVSPVVPVSPPLIDPEPVHSSGERRRHFPGEISEFEEDFFEWLMSLIVKPDDVIVLPHLPDPDDEKIYRLQVGFYSDVIAAERAQRLVEALGFKVSLEIFSTFRLVYADNIPAAQVYSVIERLGAFGFWKIWVRER